MQCPKCGYVRTAHDTNPEWQCPSCQIAYSKFVKTTRVLKKYIPNVIPADVRRFNLFASLFLLAYGAYGIHVNDLYIRTRRGRVSLHLHNESAFIMYAAFLCACIVMVSVIIDHYDQRDNESTYRSVGTVFRIAGWGLFGISLAYAITHHQIN